MIKRTNIQSIIKVFYLVIIVLCFTACSCEYNMTITEDDIIKEDLIITENKSIVEYKVIQNIKADDEIFDCEFIEDFECKKRNFEVEPEYYINNYIDNLTASSFMYLYKTYAEEANYGQTLTDKRTDDIDNYGVTYSKQEDIEFTDMALLNLISNDYSIKKENDYIYININGINSKFSNNVDNAKINIKTIYSSSNNNADYISKDGNYNVYTWDYQKNDNSDIDLILDANEKSLENSKIIGNIKDKWILILIVVSILGIITVIMIEIIFKSKKSNKV